MNWLEAKLLRKPTTDIVIEFLNTHVPEFGFPKRLRTDPATIFRSENLKQFWADHFIKHVECPIGDHRGNDKIERPQQQMAAVHLNESFERNQLP